MSKWIEFHEEPTDGKTRKFWVHRPGSKTEFASIEWDGNHKEYRMFTTRYKSFNPEMLEEISTLIKKLMEERKK